jgi:hypothetical protein
MIWRASIALAALAASGCSWGEPPFPAVTGVAPSSVEAGRAIVLTVGGEGFEPDVAVDFDDPAASKACVPFRVELRSASEGTVLLDGPVWISPSELRVQLGGGEPIGPWDVAIVDGRGREAVLPGAFTVRSCSSECVDGNRCTRNDRCGTSGFCEPGTRDLDGTVCTLDCIAGGIPPIGRCSEGRCEVPVNACPTPLAACSPE